MTTPIKPISGKSTPGPWRVDQGCYAVRADALPLSAKTGLDSGVVCTAVHSPADARLIAKAPEMYLDLVILCEHIESWRLVINGPEYASVREDMRREIATVRALLAKVEGQR